MKKLLLLVVLLAAAGCAKKELPPPAPGAPTVLPGDCQLTVTWIPVNPAKTYSVFYNDEENTPETAAEFTADSNNTDNVCIITGLTNGTPYYVWVRGENSAGLGVFSPPSCATPRASTITITASVGLHGGINPIGNITVNIGSNQQFIITPEAHYHIQDVIVDGSSVGAVASYTFTDVTSDHTISASFAVDTYLINAGAGSGGCIDPSGNVMVDYWGSQTFVFTPDANYHIANVYVDGIAKGAVSSYTFSNVTADHTISAEFAVDTCTITASAGSGGSISPSGAVEVPYGGGKQFVITPNTGYYIADVLVNGASVGPVSSYTFNNVTSACTIQAAFNICAYYLTMTAGGSGGGAVTPSGTITVNYGEAVSISASPDSTSTFSGWSVTSGSASIANPGSASTTVTLTSGDATVRANFTRKLYTVKYGALPEWGIISYSYDGGSGSGTSGSLTVPGMARITFLATPNRGYKFIGWHGVDGFDGNTAWVTVNGDEDITAYFLKGEERSRSKLIGYLRGMFFRMCLLLSLKTMLYLWC